MHLQPSQHALRVVYFGDWEVQVVLEGVHHPLPLLRHTDTTHSFQIYQQGCMVASGLTCRHRFYPYAKRQ